MTAVYLNLIPTKGDFWRVTSHSWDKIDITTKSIVNAIISTIIVDTNNYTNK